MSQYPFSAHIVQHFLLALVIPALMLLGTPRWIREAALQRAILKKLERVIGQPPVSWLVGVGTMLAWHTPACFNAAMTNEGLHIFQLLSFPISGLIFWWPILGALEDRQLKALSAVAYLFSACVCCSLLGAFLTFGPVGLYPAGPDPKSDQQLGGILMWVPGCFAYLSGILSTVMRWYGEERAA